MNYMEPLRTALSDPSGSRSRSRSRQSRKERLRALEATVDHLAARVETLEASVNTLKSKTTHLERDRSFWRKFLVGLWKIFNGNTVESLALPRDQYEDELSWEELNQQAATRDALLDQEEAAAPTGIDAEGMTEWGCRQLATNNDPVAANQRTSCDSGPVRSTLEYLGSLLSSHRAQLREFALASKLAHVRAK